MEGPIERAFGHGLHLSGPLMDMYLERIGFCVIEKLKKKDITGLTKSFKEFVLLPIFHNLLRIFTAYGCGTSTLYPPKKKTTTSTKKSE